MKWICLSLLPVCLPITFHALPTGEENKNGNVRFERQENRLSIHASDDSIIHYQTFDIGRNETVEFIQPSSASRVLNRIQSLAPSQIDGQITANGRVYLVNPMGVVFGKHSVIDVGIIFASGGKIRDEDFLAHRDIFFDLQGDVLNWGLIKGEEIHLIGARVENEGRIEAPDGFVTMAAGNTVWIREKEGSCFVAVDQAPLAIGAADLVGYAIYNSGTIAASSIHLEGDQVQIEGNLHSPEGTVKVLGDDIVLQSVKIDASGPSRGGTVLIGGDYQGKGDSRQSKSVWMKEDASIDVSAIQSGDGGLSVLWSKGMTVFNGQILARGGQEGGDGGVVETSGYLGLGSAHGKVDTWASAGKTGNWLLDPETIEVNLTGTSTLTDVANCSDTTSSLQIANTTINSAISNVTLCATTTITVDLGAPINIGASGVGITFQTPVGQVAQVLSNIDDSITTNSGDITFTNSTTTINAGATVYAQGTGSISIGNLDIGLGTGPAATLQVETGNLTISQTATLNSGLILVSGGGIISTFNIVGNSNDLTINSTGIVSIGGDASSIGTLTVTNSASTTFVGTTSAANVILTNSASFIEFGLGVTFGSIATTTNPYQTIFETGGTVTNAATFYNMGGVEFGTASTAGNITFTGGLNTNQTGVTTSTNGVVATTGTPMTLGPVVLLGDTTMNTSNGALTFNSTLTGANNLTVNTGNTAPLFTGAVSIGDVASNISLTINTTGTNTIFSNTLTTIGGLTSNDNVVFNNNVSIGGAVNLPSLTTNVVPLSAYSVAFLGGGSVTAFTQFANTGTITFGSASLPMLTFTNGVTTANGPSSTIVQGTVQATAAATPITFGMTIFGTGNDVLMTSDGLLTIGNATLTGNAILTTGGANLTAGIVSGVGNFITTSGSTGTTTIGGLTCGVFTPSNSLNVTVTGETTASTVNLTGMSNSQALIFNGPVNISTNFFTSASSYSIAFNAGGTVTPLTNFFNAGGVTFGNSASSAITFTNGMNTNYTGVATYAFGSIQASVGPITFGPLTLNGNTSVRNTSNPILFASTINGPYSFAAIDAGGPITFSGVAGGAAPLYSLFASGSVVNIGANMTAFGNSISFGSPVTLLSTVVLMDTGSGISFASTIDGAFGLTLIATTAGSIFGSGAVGSGTALTSLSATAAESIGFGSSINTTGASSVSGGNISFTAGGSIGVNGAITALGGANGSNGGTVTMTSSKGSVSVASIDVSGGAGNGFPGGNAGSISLQPATGYAFSKKFGNFPNAFLNVSGTLNALGGSGPPNGSAGTISLSPAGRSTTMSVATITGNSSLTINGSNLFIGPNEAMTILGNATFNLQNTAALGDLVALQSIAINAETIDLILHQPGQILDNYGVLYPNSQMHAISGDPSLSGAIITTGSGASPKIRSVHLAPAQFRSLLFYGGTILNFDRNYAPISGILDWVLRTDYWDTTPLKHHLSHKQMLAIRISQNLAPHLNQLWLAIERKKSNPIEMAIAKYQADKDLHDALISLPEFTTYLRRFDPKGALSYLSSIQTLLTGMIHRSTKKTATDLFTSLGRANFPGEIGPKPAQFFTDDVLEFTKPDSLTSSQWRSLVLHD